MKRLTQIVLIILSMNALNSYAESLSLVWQAEGFKQPESVVFDSKRNQYYVSNINDGILEQDGNGSIGLIDRQGNVVAIDWITGLDSPKGLALKGCHLYVADVGSLVVINVDSAKIVARYYAAESILLNDVTISPRGKVFVSDTVGNTIYALSGSELKVWLHSDELDSPNGLFATRHALYVGAWGGDIQDDFSTLTSGGLKLVSLRDKGIRQLDHEESWMNIDGLESLGKHGGWLATDYFAGSLLEFGKDGYLISTYPLEISAADHEYDAKNDLVIVPIMNTGVIKAYRR